MSYTRNIVWALLGWAAAIAGLKAGLGAADMVMKVAALSVAAGATVAGALALVRLTVIDAEGQLGRTD